MPPRSRSRTADRLLLQRGIVQTQLFTDAEAALRDADAALRLAATAAPGNRSFEGQLNTLKGRALLNLGRFDEARAELETALRLLGNLTMRVDRADLLARSDLAIAALLSGRADDARRYLAYTGAGRFTRGSIVAGDEQRLALVRARDRTGRRRRDRGLCRRGREGRQRHADLRVAAGAERDRLRPRGCAMDVRSRRGSRGAGLVPLGVAHGGPLRRPAARTLCRQRRYRSSSGWPPPIRPGQRAIAARAHRSGVALRAELAAQDRAASPAPRETLPLLLLLAARDGLPHEEHEAMYRRALPLAAEADAPPTADRRHRHRHRPRAADAARRPRIGRRPGPLMRLLALPEIRARRRRRRFVRLDRARHSFWQGDYDRALAIAAEVRALPEAGGDGLIRTEALEIESGVHAARQDPAAARAAFEAIGPGAMRCGLPPRQRRLSASSNDFPNDALRWGFEGWAVSEISASADGDAVQSRTVMAYPPFVFGESARRITDRARFEPSYRPDPAPCPITRRRVRFVLPD